MKRTFIRVFVTLILALCLLISVSAVAESGYFSEEMGAALSDAFVQKVYSFDTLLTEEEKVIYYALLPEHLHNLFWTDDWESFERAIRSCTTLDDIRKLMNDTYIGITEAESGRPQLRDIRPLADIILDDAKNCR